MSNNTVRLVRLAPLTLKEEHAVKGTPTLVWSVRMTYPRITVYTDNNSYSKDKFDYNTMITAPFDIINLNMFLEAFSAIIESKDNDVKRSVDCFNIKYENGEKTNDIYLQAKAVVGKDKEGIIYLAVVATGKKKVKFNLLPDEKFFKHRNTGGDIIENRAELSAMHARAYLKVLNKLMNRYVLDETQAVSHNERKPGGFGKPTTPQAPVAGDPLAQLV